MQLALIHRPAGSALARSDARLWRTCLREIQFLEDGPTAEMGDEILTDEAAYKLLIEIVCGLRSPIIGETEVQAQFKSFLATLNPSLDAGLIRVGQRVLADAKHVRTQHLQGFGAHSYGYLANRYVPAERPVVLVGTGALANEILTALGSHRVVDQWGRRDLAEDASRAHVRFFHLYETPLVERTGGTVALVIAAPISAADLARVMSEYGSIAEIVDLRSADERSSFPTGRTVVTLEDLFAVAASEAPPAAGRLEAARREIDRLAHAYARREELRPFGWDDICA